MQCLAIGGPEHDPEKHVPAKAGMDTGFRKRSCLNNEIERGSDLIRADSGPGERYETNLSIGAPRYRLSPSGGHAIKRVVRRFE